MPELRPYQQAAVDAVYEHLRTRDDNPCVVLPTGCHAKGHPILMYDGSVKKVEDIVVGDLLMGPDETPRRVLQLARGREPMVRIVPAAGSGLPAFTVNRHHLMPVYRHETNTCDTECVGDIRPGEDVKFLHRRCSGCFECVPFAVEPLPEDDFYGFTLEGDHLYLDGNYVISHNTGKSLVLGRIASDAVSLWYGRVLVLAHVKELLEQNADKVRKLCPELKVGI